MKYILCLTSLVFSFIAVAQISTNYVDADNISSTAWSTYVENQDVRIELKRADCDINSGLAQQYLFVRLTNKTQNDITLNWEMELHYNNDCKTCGVGEYQWEYDLAPSQVAVGECTLDADKRLRLFTKFIDPNYTNTSELTGFNFKNLIID